jgi:hypothetical protein
MAVKILQWILRVMVLATLTLGITTWLAMAGVVDPHILENGIVEVHMLCGLSVALSFLIHNIIMLFTRGVRGLGGVGIVYALVIPAFGLTQDMILPGSMHWLIQTLHLLVGVGALFLTEIMARRYRTAKQGVGHVVMKQAA